MTDGGGHRRGGPLCLTGQADTCPLLRSAPRADPQRRSLTLASPSSSRSWVLATQAVQRLLRGELVVHEQPGKEDVQQTGAVQGLCRAGSDAPCASRPAPGCQQWAMGLRASVAGEETRPARVCVC